MLSSPAAVQHNPVLLTKNGSIHMAWNETTEPLYKRSLDRFETDVTDAEWAVAVPLLPPPSRMGRKPITDLREVFNAVWFMLATGCQWRSIPKCFPPFKACGQIGLRFGRFAVRITITSAGAAPQARRAER